MKTRLLVVTVLCLSALLMACEPIHPLPPANPAPVLTAHEQANLTVVQNLYQVLTRGNITVLTERWHQHLIKQLDEADQRGERRPQCCASCEL